MVKKEKKNYGCLCGMNFGNRKDNYLYHINRINPCEALAQKTPKTPEITPKTPEITPKTPELNNNIVLCVEVKEVEEVKEIKYPCEFCNQNFSRKYSLDRHQNGRCKNKPKQIEQEIVDNKLIEIDNKLNIILKQNEELRDENKKLKKQIKRTKKIKLTKTINSHNKNINIEQQNIVNNNIVVNFNDMKLEDVDKKLFIQPIMNARLYGKAIILQMIENIYINEAHPEYQNFIITDKNRGYIKIYNGGKWKTDDIQMINFVIDGIITESKNILVELKQKYINNNPAQNRIDTSEKYINLCDLEYLGDLEDAQENDGVNNIAIITRCKKFREMVYKDTINLFHDNKDLLLKSKNKTDKIIELN